LIDSGNTVERGNSKYQHIARAHLNKGKNLLLAKVDQKVLDWSFSLRLSSLEEARQKAIEYHAAYGPMPNKSRYGRDRRPSGVRGKTELRKDGSVPRNGVYVDSVVSAAKNKIQIRGTPTLIIVDRSGNVIALWAGQLSADKEHEVMVAIGKLT